jgi:hypothetical protein
MMEGRQIQSSCQGSLKITSTLGLCVLAVCLVPSVVRADSNLVLNPGLTAGSGDSPQHWMHDPDTQPPGDVTFEWLQDQQEPELEVWNYEPLDSSWKQTVHLKPGWCHFTASVRTENVGAIDTGANLSIMESWIKSRDVKGTGYWEAIGFYLRIPKEADVVLACRLGFYSSENTGRAYFRSPSVTKVGGPAADDPGFKLETWAEHTPATK